VISLNYLALTFLNPTKICLAQTKIQLMKAKEIQELIDYISNSGLAEVKIKTDEFELSIKKYADQSGTRYVESAPAPSAAPGAVPSSAPAAAASAAPTPAGR